MKKTKITKLTITALSLILSVNFLGGSLLCLKNDSKMVALESAKKEDSSKNINNADKCKCKKGDKDKKQDKENEEKNNENEEEDNTKNTKDYKNKMKNEMKKDLEED